MGQVPGIKTEQSSTPRKILLSPNNARYLPGGKILAGSQARDPGNTAHIDTLRAGMVLGKRSNDNKYAPSIIGLLTTALAAGGASAIMGALAGDEVARRITVGGIFKVIGCPAAAVDEVQTFTTNANATGGTFTISFNGDTTSPIAYDATATQVNTAIALLEDLAAGDIEMTAGDEIDTATSIVMTLKSTLLAKLGLTTLPMLEWDIDSTTTTVACEGVRTTLGQAANVCNVSRALSLSAEAAGTVTLAANSAVAEIQTCTINEVSTAGTFTLTYKGQTTAALAWNCSSAQMQAALELLSTVNPGDITVQAANEPDTSTTQTYTFLGILGNVSMLSMNSSLLTGTTGVVTNAFAETTPGELVAYATTLRSFAIGSMVVPADGSEVPVTFVIAETGMKVTDVDSNNIDIELPKVLIGGQIYAAGIVDYPTDGPAQTWLKEQFGANFTFDDDY